MERLSAVLSKAIDVSAESLGKDDLRECFGEDVYNKMRDTVDGSFMTLLAKAQQLIQTRFEELSEQRNLNTKLAELEKAKVSVGDRVSTDIVTPDDDVLSATVIEVQKMEADKLKSAMDKMATFAETQKKKMSVLTKAMEDQRQALLLEVGEKFREASEAL